MCELCGMLGGPFWEDRYHATAVQTGTHLARCLVYIDMNMVRAGVVDHPQQWEHGGYHEILSPRERYRLISHDALLASLGMSDQEQLQREYPGWIAQALAARPRRTRETRWTEALAIGDEAFTQEVQIKLKEENRGSSTSKSIASEESGEGFDLKEAENPYRHTVDFAQGSLRVEFDENPG